MVRPPYRKKGGGVVIGIRKKVMNLSVSISEPNDFVIETTKGLSIEYIGGIEPCGQFEWDEILNNNLENVDSFY